MSIVICNRCQKYVDSDVHEVEWIKDEPYCEACRDAIMILEDNDE